MPGPGFDALLNELSLMAAKDGLPTYAELRQQLADARAAGDAAKEASVGHGIGAWLFAIGKATRVHRDMPIDPIEMLELAADYLQAAADAAGRAGDMAQRRLSMYQLGSAQYELERYDVAERVLRDAFALPVDGQVTIEYVIARDLGDTTLARGDLPAALESYNHALPLAQTIGDPYEEATIYGKSAAVLERMNRFEDASAMYERARDRYGDIARDSSLRSAITVAPHVAGASDMSVSIAYVEGRLERVRAKRATEEALAVLPLRLATSYRHAAHYVRQLADTEERFANRLMSAAAGREFDDDFAQIRQGQGWAAAQAGNLSLATKLCVDYALTGVHLRDVRTSSADRERWASAALDAARGLGDTDAEAKLLINSSWDSADRGRTDEARERVDRALALAHAAGNSRLRGQALLSLSHLHNLTGHYAEAAAASTEARALLGEKDAEEDDRYLSNLVVIYQNTGEHEKALQFAQRDVDAARERGDRPRESRALGNLGLAYHVLGRYEEAMTYQQRSLELARANGNKRAEAAALCNSGVSAMELRRFAEAEASFQQAVALARELGDLGGEEGGLGNLGHVFQLTGRHQQALDSIDAAMRIARTRGHRVGEANAFQALAKVHLDLRDYAQAAACAEQSLTIASEIGQRSIEAGSLVTLGRIALFSGERKKAVSLLTQSLQLARLGRERATEAIIHLNMALALDGLGRREEALSHAEEALGYFREVGSELDIQATAGLIARMSPGAPSNADPNLFDLLFEWMRIPVTDVGPSQEFLRAHQDQLLTATAETALQTLAARVPDNSNYLRHHKLVQRARQNGIEATYQDYSRHVMARVIADFQEWIGSAEGAQVMEMLDGWVRQPDKSTSQRYLEEHSGQLLTINASMALGLLAKKAEDGARYREFSDLLQACRTSAVDTAYAPFDTVYWHLPLAQVLLSWFAAPTEEYLRLHAEELLTNEAEYVLELLLARESNWGVALFLDLIRNARGIGIDAAMRLFRDAETGGPQPA